MRCSPCPHGNYSSSRRDMRINCSLTSLLPCLSWLVSGKAAAPGHQAACGLVGETEETAERAPGSAVKAFTEGSLWEGRARAVEG